MTILPSTLGSLIRRLIPSVRRTTGKVVQIDADTIRVRREGSTTYIRNVPIVGASISDVVIGEEVELDILAGKPYAYKLKSL
jgi:hypothetical protein